MPEENWRYGGPQQFVQDVNTDAHFKHVLHSRIDRDACVIGSRIVLSPYHACLHMSVPPSSLSSSSSTSSTSQVTLPINKHCDDPHNEECGFVIFTSSTGSEPNVMDNCNYSETQTAIFQNESVDIDTEPPYSCDAEFDDELIGKTLSSPLFIQEREEPANLRQTSHSHEESLLPAQFFFTRTSTVRPVYELSSSQKKRKSSREMENEGIRILLGQIQRANSR